jgi:hypothetical protein
LSLIRTNYVSIPLSTRLRGEQRVPLRSGLNWGQRPGRNHNQAYLPIPANVQKNAFFPTRGVKFLMNCDDGASFECVIAQDKGKALETPDDNSFLGLYFRQRLGLSDGQLILFYHLQKYGRITVDIFKDTEYEYFLDFSKP